MSITVKQITCREHGAEYQTWMVDGYVNGKRIRIRCKSEDEARMRKSEEETKAINAERSSRFIQTRLTFAQLNEAEACFDRLAPKYSLTNAVDYFLKRFHAPDFAITVGEASTKFRGAMEGVIRDRTLIQLKSTLGQFERFTDNCSVHEVTSETVERFLNSLRAKNGTDKASRKTWNNYRGDLHQFFVWCREKQQRYVSENPVTDVKRFEIDGGHVEVLTVKRARELMDYVAAFKEGKLVRYFALALFAGIRPGGELKKLANSPELIDLENKVIRITPAISKTRQFRQIQIRPNLYKWLKRYPGEILPAQSYTDLTATRKQFKLSHDICRHTFCSAHVMAFGSFAETAIESGNSESIICTHYFNAIPKSQAKEIWKIEPNP
jgi:Phage integrase, N-terminal SAM-like domain